MPKNKSKKKMQRPRAAPSQSQQANATYIGRSPRKGKGDRHTKHTSIDDMSMNEFDNVLNAALAETKAKEKAATKKAAEIAKTKEWKEQESVIYTPESTPPSMGDEDEISDRATTSSASTIRNSAPDVRRTPSWVPYVLDYCLKFDFMVKIKKVMLENKEDYSIFFPGDEIASDDQRNLHYVPKSKKSDSSDSESDDDLTDPEVSSHFDHERIRELSDSDEASPNLLTGDPDAGTKTMSHKKEAMVPNSPSKSLPETKLHTSKASSPSFEAMTSSTINTEPKTSCPAHGTQISVSIIADVAPHQDLED